MKAIPMNASFLTACWLLLAPITAQEIVEPSKEILQARSGDEIPLELGYVEVPENRKDPESRTISLAVLRAKSPLENPGPPVFMLAGGPGGSSLDMVRSLLSGGGPMFLRMLGGDLVAIDQRGVGRSRPNLETETLFPIPLEPPTDPEELLKIIRRTCREEAGRWRKEGVDLAGYTTVESADDIDVVRRAFGYEKIVLWGESYGTHLALSTIRRHGEHVARAVLIGPEGPDHTLKLPTYTQEGLEAVAKLVSADPKLSAAVPDLVGMLEKVIDRLREAPVVVEVDGVEVGIGAFDVQTVVALALGRTRGGVDRIPALVKAMHDGDFSDVAEEVLSERRGWGIRSAMQMVMDSASGASEERRRRIAREAKTCLLGDVINFPFGDLAEAWGAPDLGPEFRAPLVSEVPVLFLVGDLDSRTPVRNARELLTGLPNAHLIVIAHAGHDVNWIQKEIRDAWGAFLAGKEVTVTEVTAPLPSWVPPR